MWSNSTKENQKIKRSRDHDTEKTSYSVSGVVGILLLPDVDPPPPPKVLRDDRPIKRSTGTEILRLKSTTPPPPPLFTP